MPPAGPTAIKLLISTRGIQGSRSGTRLLDSADKPRNIENSELNGGAWVFRLVVYYWFELLTGIALSSACSACCWAASFCCSAAAIDALSAFVSFSCWMMAAVLSGVLVSIAGEELSTGV